MCTDLKRHPQVLKCTCITTNAIGFYFKILDIKTCPWFFWNHKTIKCKKELKNYVRNSFKRKNEFETIDGRHHSVDCIVCYLLLGIILINVCKLFRFRVSFGDHRASYGPYGKKDGVPFALHASAGAASAHDLANSSMRLAPMWGWTIIEHAHGACQIYVLRTWDEHTR